jgi:hypothetical protein
VSKKKTEDRIRLFLETKHVESFTDALDAASPRPVEDAAQADKKNYAERLSKALSVLIANRLRPTFPPILPLPDGTRQESRAPTGKGKKKLDVNYSTQELGLALGVSIKTLNFRDDASGRYTKNATRIDNELRAEASDYHERQPFAVMVGIVFVPIDSCDDAKRGKSSFAQIVEVLRHRANRETPKNREELFERIYIALYDYAMRPASVEFFDVGRLAPPAGRPPVGGGATVLSHSSPAVREPINIRCDVDEMVRQVVAFYKTRNKIA